jgi:hypothetical protein
MAGSFLGSPAVLPHESAAEELLAAHAPAAEQIAPGTQPPAKQTVAFNADGADAMSDNKKSSSFPGDDGADDLQFLTPATRPDSLGRLGHYEMLQVLGRGGFGIVFRAFDDVLQRVVAVKVMAPQIATLSPARKRFLREARSSAPIRHENVVQVHEVGEQPLPHLVMEFVPGETLQQKLDRCGPLDLPEVLRIGRQIAEGLAAAHACDLIHRDIKPANILLEGGSHKAKITDFGLARAADDASISQSGIIAGTPMFMAPEQAQGHQIDQRADLFSLGSVLYQMVSGRPPFRAPGALAVLKRVAEEPPRPITEIIPETPDWLCGIIAKLHAKDPKDRFQSAREVADLLAQCEAQLKAKQEVHNVLPAAVQPVAPTSSVGRTWVAAAAVLLLPMIVLAVTEFAGVTHLFLWPDGGQTAPIELAEKEPQPEEKKMPAPFTAEQGVKTTKELSPNPPVTGGTVVIKLPGQPTMTLDVLPKGVAEPFAPLAADIREGRYQAPDLSQAKPIFKDRFQDPARGWGTAKADQYERGYQGGRYWRSLLHCRRAGNMVPAELPGEARRRVRLRSRRPHDRGARLRLVPQPSQRGPTYPPVHVERSTRT